MVTENGIQSDGNTSFLRAARAGNLDKVLEHLKNNIDINTCNANGLNALHLASKDGHVHVVQELLRRGAIVDSATKKGNTALHIASLAGQEDVVKLLLQHNASVNVQSQNGFTPLYMAAQENHDSVVKLLLSNGANQSLATEDGFTPLAVAMQQGHDKVVAVLLESDTRGKVRLPALHIAAKKDDVKAATLLLENDHNPDVTSKSGFTPLHIASHYGNEAIANLLVQKGADVNYAAKHNISPLHVAAKWGKTNMVSLLLEKGANIESKTRDGLTPLHCAARSGHEQVVDMLLERGAPISAKTKNGLAPLHMAAQGEHVDAARILLYHRAPVDEVTVDYLTALHVAAHCGHVRVAKLLLDRNADANARALNGFTPLHIACKKNRIKVVELLLKHGASISATTESGLTPLHVASFMGCMNIVIYLLQHDASPDVPTVRGETPLHLAARANQTDIIRILLRNGAQVDARAREQQTPLHIASRLGNVDIVMLLLQHGAQVDATTKDMYTALHIAAKEGQDEVAGVLIENGASLNSTTKKGFTPLHLTAKYGNIKVAQLLLQKDAPVDAQGKNGVTPLHVASHYDHQNVALLLLEKGASPHATAKNGHTPLHIAGRKNQMDIATTLLEYGANANAESKAGFTPLHLSAQEGHSDMSNLLLEHKASPNHQAKNGLTPMHLCAQEDRVNVAETLVKHEADVNSTTKAGYTPLHVASHFGQSNMVRFLLQNGCNFESETQIGYTPLHQAAQQGHIHIVTLLLENQANPDAVTQNGQTPLDIAQKLGYISVYDSLKVVTTEKTPPMQTSMNDEKYRVVAPEAMHETFMSDSEEEGGEENALNDQPYRYLTVDEMKSLGDDSLPIDVTRDERIDSNKMVQSTDSNILPPQAIEDSLSPQHVSLQMRGHSQVDSKYSADNIELGAHPQQYGKLHWKNFLVSFLVDARGGALRGCRHSGVRIIVPPRSAAQPTRITCRYVKPQRTMHPPQLMEGEALASRVLELGPVGAKFLGPVIMEVPHFASLRGKEREIVILRSDNGETWREHQIDNSEEIMQDVLNESFEPEDIVAMDDLGGNRVCRFVTYDFPQYFAVVSRIRQEVHAIGPEGGMVSSTVVPQVQAVFPQGALTKKIKVGLQAQPIDPDLTAKLLGRGVAVSPIVTVEPRRRKFHKAITLSMPAPKAHSQGMINQYSGNAPTLRLLCSITGGPTRAQWEDVTGSTPLTFVNDCVSFTTTVSARFWLMDCRNISEATKMATELYREAIHVPFMANFVVFAKRIDPMEARLRVFCMTDDKEDKTLEHQEYFTEVAKSRDVEVLEGKPQYIEMAGNVVPITKSGEQLQLSFKAFRENRLPFSVRVKDQHADTVGRALFMREPKVAKGEPPQQPICILNIVLPDKIMPDSINILDDNQDVITRINVQEIQKRLMPDSFNYLGELRIVDISNLIGEDWIRLSPEIGITDSEIQEIIENNPDSTAKQAQSMLRTYQTKKHNDRTILEKGLKAIGRDDVIKKCIKFTSNGDVHVVRRHISLDDERDLMKDSESIEELTINEDTRLRQLHEREEMKYSAEEKIIEDSESDEDETVKRTVAERRTQIEKRLSVERQIPASTQKKEIVEEITTIKRQSMIEDKKAMHEEEIMHQTPIENVIKPITIAEPILKLKSGESIKDSTEIDKDVFEKELKDKMKVTIKGLDSDFEDDSSSKEVDSKIHLDSKETEKSQMPASIDNYEEIERQVFQVKSTITNIEPNLQAFESEFHEKVIKDEENIMEKKVQISDSIKREVMDKTDPELMHKLEIQKEKIEHSTRLIDDVLENATQKVTETITETRRSVEREVTSLKEQVIETPPPSPEFQPPKESGVQLKDAPSEKPLTDVEVSDTESLKDKLRYESGIPKPTALLTKTDTKATDEQKTLTFSEKKQFWESIESPPKEEPSKVPEIKEKKSQIPVPKPKTQKPTTSAPGTPKTINKESHIPIRTDLHDRKPVIDQQTDSKDMKTCIDQITEPTESEDDEETQAKFYIGEKSSNIITKTQTERRSEFAFDNEGFCSTQDSYDDDLLIDNETMKPSNKEVSVDKSEFEGLEKKLVSKEREVVKGNKIVESIPEEEFLIKEDLKNKTSVEEVSKIDTSIKQDEYHSFEERKQDETKEIVSSINTFSTESKTEEIKHHSHFEEKKPEEIIAITSQFLEHETGILSNKDLKDTKTEVKTEEITLKEHYDYEENIPEELKKVHTEYTEQQTKILTDQTLENLTTSHKTEEVKQQELYIEERRPEEVREITRQFLEHETKIISTKRTDDPKRELKTEEVKQFEEKIHTAEIISDNSQYEFKTELKTDVTKKEEDYTFKEQKPEELKEASIQSIEHQKNIMFEDDTINEFKAIETKQVTQQELYIEERRPEEVREITRQFLERETKIITSKKIELNDEDKFDKGAAPKAQYATKWEDKTIETSTLTENKLDLHIEEKLGKSSNESQLKTEIAEEIFEVSNRVVHTPIEPHQSTMTFEHPEELEKHVVPTAQAIIAIEVDKSLEIVKHKVSLENISEVKDILHQKSISSNQDISETYSKSQISEMDVEQTLNEVKDSIDAIQEELIGVVKDGKLIKESPSEFEFKALSQVKYSEPIIELSNEEILPGDLPTKETNIFEPQQKEVSFVKVTEVDFVKQELSASPQLSSNEDSSNKLEVNKRKIKPTDPGTQRWSTTDPENYSGSDQSHYQSFERTESRPLSSDIENYLTSEYQTAMDQPSSFKIGSTTEYLSAVSTFDHSSKTISSRESMKSLDSESSGNLGSIEVSDASETLIPSTLDIEIEGSDIDIDDEEQEKYGSLETKGETILLEFDSSEVSNAMKRSQEMTFQPEPTPIQLVEEQELTETFKPTGIVSESLKVGDSGSFEDVKFASSLEEGSLLSVSLSSTSNVDTIVENRLEDDIGSLSGSLVGSYELAGHLTEEVLSTSYEKGYEYPSQVEDRSTPVINDSRIVQEATEYSSDSLNDKRPKGHKRNESTSFVPFTGSIPSTQVDFDDLSEEMIIHEDEPLPTIDNKKPVEDKKDSESDSDYDRYETEYSRAYKVPADPVFKGKRQSEMKTIELEKDKDIRRSRSPSQSFIEPIMEDETAEKEQEEAPQVKRVLQPGDFKDVPNITITDDPNKYVSDSDEEPYIKDDPPQYQHSKPEKVIETSTTVQVLKESHITQQPSTINYAQEVEYKMSEEQYETLIEQQYKSKMAEHKDQYEKHDRDSPGSDSFEMLEQPDLTDEFVIIEEVAKEADEFDTEGKSVKIQKTTYEKKHDVEVEKIVVRSAPADPHEGSALYGNIHHEDMGFDFEESPPLDESNGSGIGQDSDYNKRWVEMQLEDQQNLRYPYDLERGVLEDIKEEDTDLEVGSSRISSFKDSFSSTPDYDLHKKHQTKENDDISMNSLQEFESLEQAISLENRKYIQSSLDSLSNGSFPKRYLGRSADGDGISMSSLKEFEGIENACVEAHLLEIKAKEEAALLLSRSDESNKSDESGKIKVSKTTTTTTTDSGGRVTTVTKTVVSSSVTEDQDALFKVFDTKQQFSIKDDSLSNIMETSIDSLEGSGRSRQTQDTRRDSLDSLDTNNKSLDLMTSSVDSIEINRDGRQSSRSNADSLDKMVIPSSQSIDSIELNDPKLTDSGFGQISSQTIIRTVTTTTTGPIQIPKDISNDSLNSNSNLHVTDQDLHYLTSSESMDNSSSTATNATYRNASDSQMSGSVTSCDSNTMIDTLDSNFADMYGSLSYSPRPFEEKYQVTTTTSTDGGFTTMTTMTTTSTIRQEKRDQFEEKH